MSPKFKDNPNNWLDDEADRKGQGGKRSKHRAAKAASEPLPPSKANAVVAEVFPNQCRVNLLHSQETRLLCSYRRAIVFGGKGAQSDSGRDRTPVAVGDLVFVKETGGATGVVEGVCERTNTLSRPAPGRDSGKFYHVLAANLDILVIVASVYEPEFSPGLIDRFLVAAEAENIPVVLGVTKFDLHKGDSRPWALYQELGYPVFELSAQKGLGLNALVAHLMDRKVAFCGQSGVGKTSLLGALFGRNIGKVGEVNQATGKGRHTTSSAILLGGPGNSMWIDTPGVREFGLSRITAQSLGQFFKEFRNLSCTESNCLHLDEVECAARNLPRYPSYRRILLSLLEET